MVLVHSFNGRRRTQDVLSAASSSFAKLHLSDTLRRALLLAGYRSPSPVQETAIPLARLGTDLIVKAKSGTGKTLVFVLACVDRVDASLSFPQAVLLAPTREIAQQIASEIRKIANNLPYPNLSCGVFTGGVAVSEDRKRLRRPCHVIVATPGRLCYLVQKNEIHLDHVRLLVLDEADQLYSESLKESVQFLVSSLPSARQSLAFSATYSTEILSEVEREMDYPQRVFIEESEKPLLGVKQCYRMVKQQQQQVSPEADAVIFESKINSLFEIFSCVSFYQAVVFCNARDKAEVLSERLNASGFPSAFTSGHKSQQHRASTMSAMRQFELRVIVSTDLIARGIDLERVNLVCNLDLPYDQETYQHRIGRTGRFGTHGISVTLVTPSEKAQLERYMAEGTELLELPQQIPTEWYRDPLVNRADQMAYQKLVETPAVTSDVMQSIPPRSSDWIGNVSPSEFLSWKERLEKRHPFWNHWDPYVSSASAMSRSSSREGMVRCAAVSEISCETTGSISHQRRMNCIRLPSRLSHTTSASSIVYSEEGDCECLDADVEDQLSWFEAQSEHSDAESHGGAELTSLSTTEMRPLQPPAMPSSIQTLEEFNAIREEYETWRKKYTEWHRQYSEWYSTVQSFPPPPPQLS